MKAENKSEWSFKLKNLGKILPSIAIATALSLSINIAEAKDYLLVGTKPNKLMVVDTEAMKVSKEIAIKDGAPMPNNIVPSRDGKRAFVLVNKMEEIAEIDLKTGSEIKRIKLSTEDVRTKGLFGLDVSPDDSTLVVYKSSVKILPGEFQGLPTKIAFYDTKTGKLKYEAEAPRQITLLVYSKDGSKVYGLGRALHIFDAKTGKKIGEHKTQDWGKKNFNPVDILAVWSQFEQSGVMVTPYYTTRSDMDSKDPKAFWTGILTLDLESGDFKMREIENTDVFYFSTAVNPVNKNIGYSAYNQLTKMDLAAGKPLKRIELDHSYYAVNVSSDGKKVFIGGALGDIAVYDADSLDRLGTIYLPDGANMSLTPMRMVQH